MELVGLASKTRDLERRHATWQRSLRSHVAALRGAVEPHLVHSGDEDLLAVTPVRGADDDSAHGRAQRLSRSQLRSALQGMATSVVHEANELANSPAPMDADSLGGDEDVDTAAAALRVPERRTDNERADPASSMAPLHQPATTPPRHVADDTGDAALLGALGLLNDEADVDSPMFGGRGDEESAVLFAGDAGGDGGEGGTATSMHGERQSVGPDASGVRATPRVALEDSLMMADISGISMASSPKSAMRAPGGAALERMLFADSVRESGSDEGDSGTVGGDNGGAGDGGDDDGDGGDDGDGPLQRELAATQSALVATDQLIEAMQSSRLSGGGSGGGVAGAPHTPAPGEDADILLP